MWKRIGRHEYSRSTAERSGSKHQAALASALALVHCATGAMGFDNLCTVPSDPIRPLLMPVQVHVRPLNTILGEGWYPGDYTADLTRAAVGVPTQPRDVHLENVLNDGGEPETGKLRVM